jgi:hypothetical protein
MFRKLAVITLMVFSWAAQGQRTGAPKSPAKKIAVAAGTQVPLIVVRPVRANAVGVGNALFAQTVYPVSVGNTMAIPAGSYVQGTILSYTKPTKKDRRATFRICFTQVIFANGYVAPLASGADGDDTMDVTVQVSTANDLLLDNGAQMELKLSSPLQVNATRAKAAILLSHTPKPGSLASATSCVPQAGTPSTPGTPGTPDTVIPGTPDTVIPGIDGGPDTVIPGTPATTIPGSPGTPGDPGTPDVLCPAAPLVISSVPVNAAAMQSVSATK